MYISVIGAGECGPDLEAKAMETGSEIARRGHTLVCGGLGGVMDAAARGASSAGGLSIGILPDAERGGSSTWLTCSVPTGMGEARNALVVRAGDVLIAIGGGYGTLSEIALALKASKTVIGIDTWALPGDLPWGVVEASDPVEAVDLAEKAVQGGAR
jgi:hypothetical protein